MSDFEPPKYIEKLIGAVNDGAKAAQLGALAFVAIGLFLLATSFSATDEDLLLGKSIAISQLGGVAVPVALSFGFMPAVFVAVHLYTLIRFEMLAGNVRHLMSELAAQVKLEADRVRCRQLLANVEFIQALAVPGASWVYRWTAWGIIAVFPVMVLVLVQLGSLRLQSNVVNAVHHVAIVADLVLLVWFSLRLRGVVALGQRKAPSGWSRWRRGAWRVWSTAGFGFRWARLVVVPVAVIAMDLAWFRVPIETETTVGDLKSWREEKRLPKGTDLGKLPLWDYLWLLAEKSWPQPVDLFMCPDIRIGCRFLSVPGRVLVGKVWDPKSVVELRSGEELDAKRKAGFEPAILRERSLLFANLSGSQMFAADLTGSRLAGSDLTGVSLRGASLRKTDLRAADLSFASLANASLGHALMQGTILSVANLRHADLYKASLQGANMGSASLDGALLIQASMQGVHLFGASADGADLTDARLEGANLGRASLKGARLYRSRLWQVKTDDETKLGLADVREVTFTPLNEDEVRNLINMVPERARISMSLAFWPPTDRGMRASTFDGPMLVSNTPSPVWQQLRKEQYTTDPVVLALPLARLLADHVALSSETAYRAVVRRIFMLDCDVLGDALLTPLRDRLLFHADAKKISLSPGQLRWLKDQKPSCVATTAGR